MSPALQTLPSFNGAAFFQSGKFATELLPSTCAIDRFNGAAFFQSGKYTGNGSHARAGRASMEPLFFKAENLLGEV